MYKETLKDGSDLLSRSRSIRKMASSSSFFKINDEDSEEIEEALGPQKKVDKEHKERLQDRYR